MACIIYRLTSGFKKDFQEKFLSKATKERQPTPLWTYTIGDGTHPSERGAETGARVIFDTVIGERGRGAEVVLTH